MQPSIVRPYRSCKHAGTCRYRACTGPMLAASDQYRPGIGTYRHVNGAPCVVIEPIFIQRGLRCPSDIGSRQARVVLLSRHQFIYPVNMTLVASTGPVLVRCWQDRPSTGPVLAHNGMFMGQPMYHRVDWIQQFNTQTVRDGEGTLEDLPGDQLHSDIYTKICVS